MTQFTLDETDRQQLIDAFVAESDDVLDDIEQSLLRLEATPENEELLQDIFRGVHTLKGNAGCLQFDDLTRFAHVMEELLDGMREGRIDANAAGVGQLLEAVDALRDLAFRSVAGDGALTEAQETLVLQLAAWAGSAGAVNHVDAGSQQPARAARSAPCGTSKGTCFSARVRLARTIRCAMAASCDRKARAISSVDRPPSIRRVSATRDSGGRTG